jgi:hypothetical protein
MKVIKFGDIDYLQIMSNELRIGVLENLMEWIMHNNQSLTLPSRGQIEDIRTGKYLNGNLSTVTDATTKALNIYKIVFLVSGVGLTLLVLFILYITYS